MRMYSFYPAIRYGWGLARCFGIASDVLLTFRIRSPAFSLRFSSLLTHLSFPEFLDASLNSYVLGRTSLEFVASTD